MANYKEYIESGKAILGIEFGSTRIKGVLIGPDNEPIAQGNHDWENQLVDNVWTYSMEKIQNGLQGLGLIYHQCKFKDVALTRLARWYDEVDKSGFLAFGRVARSIQTHYLNIINFFERRATNAAAESFNAKLKAFRAQFRGVKDKAFFLYRLTMLYA